MPPPPGDRGRGSGDDASALEHFERALAIQERTLGEQHLDVLSERLNVAVSLANLGRHAEALRLGEATAARLAARAGSDHQDTARAWAILGGVAKEAGDCDRAQVWFRRAIDALAEADRIVVAVAHLEIGRCALAQARPVRALDELGRASRVFERITASPRQCAEATFATAQALGALGFDARAVALAEDARALLETAGEPAATQLDAVAQWLRDRGAAQD